MKNEVVIHKKFEKILRPLELDEKKILEENILRDKKIRDPLVFWKEHKKFLIDGFHRLQIAEEHGLPYKKTYLSFENVDKIKTWIIKNQKGRRNLTVGQKALLASKTITEKKGGNRKPVKPITDKGLVLTKPPIGGLVDAEQAAKSFGVSQRSVERAKRIMKSKNQSVIKSLLDGKITLEKGEKQIAEKTKKPSIRLDESLYKEKKYSCGRSINIFTGKANSFSRTNENVDWALNTWNPVIGCKHGCSYCYARRIVETHKLTIYPFNKPVFFPAILEETKKLPNPTKLIFDRALKKERKRRWNEYNVFVCSIADLFGEWVPNKVIQSVFDATQEAHSRWNWIFLTKNPKRLSKFDWPKNCWAGATVDCQDRVADAEKGLGDCSADITFISVEPFLTEIKFSNLEDINMVFIGAQAPRGCKEIQPKIAWLRHLLKQLEDKHIPFLFKSNLFPVSMLKKGIK